VFVEGLIQKNAIDVIETPDFNEYVQYCKKYTPFPRFSRPTVIKLNGSLTYFLREEGKPVPPHIQQIDENTLRQADGVAGVSKYTAMKTAEYLHYNRPIEVIHNGIEIPQRKGDIPKDGRLVVFTGSLVRKKGIYQLMKAWNLVHQQIPDARLVVYGKGPIKDISEELKGDRTV
jgi:glycosyltransferase involved in cell wall biosynthesis